MGQVGYEYDLQWLPGPDRSMGYGTGIGKSFVGRFRLRVTRMWEQRSSGITEVTTGPKPPTFGTADYGEAVPSERRDDD